MIIQSGGLNYPDNPKLDFAAIGINFDSYSAKNARKICPILQKNT